MHVQHADQLERAPGADDRRAAPSIRWRPSPLPLTTVRGLPLALLLGVAVSLAWTLRWIGGQPIARAVRPGDQLEMPVTVMAPPKEGVDRLRHQLEMDGQPGLSGSPAVGTRVTMDVRRR